MTRRFLAALALNALLLVGCTGDGTEDVVARIPCEADGDAIPGCPLGLLVHGEAWVVSCDSAIPDERLGETLWSGDLSLGPDAGSWNELSEIEGVAPDVALAIRGTVPGCTSGDKAVFARPLEDKSDADWPTREVRRDELEDEFRR